MNVSRLFRILALLVLGVAASSAAEPRKKLVMLIAEHEYDTIKTLPEFAAQQLKDFNVMTVSGSTAEGQNDFDRAQEIADADVLLVSVRRRTPPKAQLDLVRRHISGGKPVVAIRTASHAFSLRKGSPATGLADWPAFDAEVIGGNYGNHHGAGPTCTVTLTAGANADHPILRGVKLPFMSAASLYRNTPLREGTQPLLTGAIPDKPAEPIAWTFTRADGGRTFYTSLGAPTDFKNPAFNQLLRNAIVWAAQQKPTRK